MCAGHCASLKQMAIYKQTVLAKHPSAELLDAYLITGDIGAFPSNPDITGLLDADCVAFIDDWHNDRGCRVGHYIAMQYGMNIEYISTEKPPRPIFRKWEIAEILQMYHDGSSVGDIASEYKATDAAVLKIINS